ncbi:hypothetical protein [Labrys miyagiensis]|nr:hypothetical protein [Labrys miyagiensis]
MSRTIRFLVLPFTRDHHGELFGLGPEEVSDAAMANFRAFNMVGKIRRSETVVGTIAFSRSGDPARGDFADASILGRYGETPEDVAGRKWGRR